MEALLPPGLDPWQITPDGHISGFSSLAFVCMHYALLALILACGAAAAIRWWRRARSAERSFRADAPLQPGELVVHGVVEHAPGEPVAVRVEVDQRGYESESSGSWTTSWAEYNRRVTVRPFFIRHASGQRIRVEPRHDVELVDAMEGVIRVNLAQRLRVAELTPGEMVYAHGRLFEEVDPEAGYRGGGRRLVMRPPGRGRLLLSTEPLGARFRRRARLHRRFTIGAAVVGLVLNLVLLPYYSSLLFGQPGQGTVTGLRHFMKKDSEDNDVHHYQVWLRVNHPEQGQLTFPDEVSDELFHKLTPNMVLPVRITRSGSSSERVGWRATYHGGVVFLLLVPLVVLALIYALSANRPLAWYEGELHESEGGRLADSEAQGSKNNASSSG